MAKGTAVDRIRITRKRIMATHLSVTVSEFPFEVSLSAWGLVAGVSAALPGIPALSVTLRDLPTIAEHLWGVAMFIGALTMAVGLRPPAPRFSILARGMTLTATALVAFGIAILGTVGWPRLLTGALLLMVGLASAIRASRLRADYYATVEELTIQHDGNGGDSRPEEG